MLRTGIVVDARYQEHDTGRHHPERPDRIATLVDSLAQYHRAGLKRFDPRLATPAEIALVHDTSHVDRVAATAQQNRFAFDADTPVSAQSYRTALLATGGLLTLLEAIMTQDIDNGFALVRPPGHHAERDRAMGFCLFNSAAIGAQYLRDRFGLNRILVMDWDVHHGNGTQHSFYDDPGVLYVSTHQYPYYPGTGALSEVGKGQGEGYTINLPLSSGCGDVEYQELFTRCDCAHLPAVQSRNLSSSPPGLTPTLVTRWVVWKSRKRALVQWRVCCCRLRRITRTDAALPFLKVAMILKGCKNPSGVCLTKWRESI